eukprot:6288247-Prymnesium_polylepis.1
MICEPRRRVTIEWPAIRPSVWPSAVRSTDCVQTAAMAGFVKRSDAARMDVCTTSDPGGMMPEAKERRQTVTPAPRCVPPRSHAFERRLQLEPIVMSRSIQTIESSDQWMPRTTSVRLGGFDVDWHRHVGADTRAPQPQHPHGEDRVGEHLAHGDPQLGAAVVDDVHPQPRERVLLVLHVVVQLRCDDPLDGRHPQHQPEEAEDDAHDEHHRETPPERDPLADR